MFIKSMAKFAKRDRHGDNVFNVSFLLEAVLLYVRHMCMYWVSRGGSGRIDGLSVRPVTE